MAYMDFDFLLQGRTAQQLYHEIAAELPIIDFHCHLPPHEIANDQRWENLTEIWLGEDHYKWRLMRANGIPEEKITGNASPREKFQALAETMPFALRNPVYDWIHLELRRCFGINELLSPATANRIWDAGNEALASPEVSARGLMRRFDVRMVGTSDDPADPLDDHAAIAASAVTTRVLPTFRPDRAMAVDQPDQLVPWLKRLGDRTSSEIGSLEALETALRNRHDDFHAMGGRLSDHGLDRCPQPLGTPEEAAGIFRAALDGHAADPLEKEKFTWHLMSFFARLDAEKGWTKQLHLGPLRRANSRMSAITGPDAGFDTMGDTAQGPTLAAFLDALDSAGTLPQMILYNINPRDNYLIAAMTGVFSGGGRPSRIQLGSGWWFMDQKEGMTMQLNALSNAGLLGRFVGMLTDSRSFLSFARHEYFRRIFCNLIGGEIDRGEIPDDEELIGSLVRAVCHGNAATHFGIEGLG